MLHCAPSIGFKKFCNVRRSALPLGLSSLPFLGAPSELAPLQTLFLAALQIAGRWAKEQVLRHGHVAIGRSKSFGVTRWYYCVLE